MVCVKCWALWALMSWQVVPNTRRVGESSDAQWNRLGVFIGPFGGTWSKIWSCPWLPITSREYPLLRGNYNIVRTIIHVHWTTHPHVTLTSGPFRCLLLHQRCAWSTCGLRPEGLRIIAPLDARLAWAHPLVDEEMKASAIDGLLLPTGSKTSLLVILRLPGHPRPPYDIVPPRRSQVKGCLCWWALRSWIYEGY